MLKRAYDFGPVFGAAGTISTVSAFRTAASLTYLCVILLPPMRHLTMRRPCRTLMPSLSHCPLHTLSAILFPHVALSFSYLRTVLLLRIPLPRADPLVLRSRRGSPFLACDVTHRARQFLFPRA